MWAQVQEIFRRATTQIADQIANFIPGLLVSLLLMQTIFGVVTALTLYFVLRSAFGVRLWLALTHHRLNQPEEARREFEQAERWAEKYPDGIPPDAEKRLGIHLHNWLEYHVLRSEVSPLLRPGPAKDK